MHHGAIYRFSLFLRVPLRRPVLKIDERIVVLCSGKVQYRGGHRGRVFLLRDAMHKRALCRHVVYVRPSVCHVRVFGQKA